MSLLRHHRVAWMGWTSLFLILRCCRTRWLLAVHPPICLFSGQTGIFYAAEDDVVGFFDGPIRLRVVNRSKDCLRAHTVTELYEELWIKLFAIIDGDFPRDPKPTDDVLPKESFDCFWCNVDEWLGFDLLCEILNSDGCVLVIALSCG